jgi:spermidine/putrescine transport system ATP-binding protein
MEKTGVLVADSVSKTFEGAAAPALNGISLNVQAGEFYSFLGPSGCGKTTLLRIFAGFEEPSSGSILIDGKAVLGIPPYRRPVNMVFQSYALFPHMSVLENVAFGLRTAKKYNKAEIGERSKEALQMVRLAEMSERLPAQLSGGQQQRVALARALVMRPVVLLLDEPLSALDVRIREEMQDELSRLKRELNLTFVMVTHDQSEALALSSRVAVFNAGNLEQVGTPSEIYERPQTAFTAGFIGRSNLLAGIVRDTGNGAIVIDCNGHKINCLATTGSESLKVGDSAYACFKPEGAHLSELSDSYSESQIPCRIATSSYQGSVVDLKLESDAIPDFSVRAIVAATDLPGLSTYSRLGLTVADGAATAIAGRRS